MAFLDETGLAELWSLICNQHNELHRYWWKRRAVQTGWTTKSTNITANVVLIAGSGTSASGTIQTANSITQNSSTGELSLVSPTNYTISYTAGADAKRTISANLKGKYIKGCYKDPNTVYKVSDTLATNGIPDTVAHSNDSSNSPRYQMHLLYSSSEVNATKIEPTSYYNYGAWEYVQSESSSAYPQSGVSGGYEYVYLGMPLENALGDRAKIVTGSYTGAGVYGTGNENRLTFDFVPKFLYVRAKTGNSSNHMLWAYGVEQATNTIDNYANYNQVTLSGNTISWYSSGTNKGASYQCNVSNVEYRYVAIG